MLPDVQFQFRDLPAGRDENGKAVRLVGAMMDVTEKKRMEEEIFRAQRMDTLGSIAGGVAHDLNNMLTPILASTEILAESPGGSDSKPLVDIIKTSALRGTELVRQILLFARGEGDLKVAIDLREFGPGGAAEGVDAEEHQAGVGGGARERWRFMRTGRNCTRCC